METSLDRPSPVDRLSQRRQVVLLLSQVALAGCVDAIGWLLLGGLFVSFMSGNSTQLAVALAGGEWEWAIRVGGLLAAFALGVFSGAVMREYSRSGSHTLMFMLAALLLGLAAVLVRVFGLNTLHMLPLAFSMGLLNSARRMVVGAPVGGTFVTGAFVAATHGIVRWMLGRAGPGAIAPYAMSWLALVTGAMIGALLVLHLGGTTALMAPAFWAAALAVAHWFTARRA